MEYFVIEYIYIYIESAHLNIIILVVTSNNVTPQLMIRVQSNENKRC